MNLMSFGDLPRTNGDRQERPNAMGQWMKQRTNNNYYTFRNMCLKDNEDVRVGTGNIPTSSISRHPPLLPLPFAPNAHSDMP